MTRAITPSRTDYDHLNRVTRKRAWQLYVGITSETDYTYDLRGLQTSATFGVGGPGVFSAYDAITVTRQLR